MAHIRLICLLSPWVRKIVNLFSPCCFTVHFFVCTPKIFIPFRILNKKSCVIALSVLTVYSFSWPLPARRILFTISPSLVRKISPSESLSNLPIGNILVLKLIKSIMFVLSLRSVVQVMPRGLLNKMYTGSVFSFKGIPSMCTRSPSETRFPFTAAFPLNQYPPVFYKAISFAAAAKACITDKLLREMSILRGKETGLKIGSPGEGFYLMCFIFLLLTGLFSY